VRNLMVVRCDEDEAFALRALLEFEDALHSIAIAWVTT
jgi:hypothetical protein